VMTRNCGWHPGCYRVGQHRSKALAGTRQGQSRSNTPAAPVAAIDESEE